jgi:thioredoxin 1
MKNIIELLVPVLVGGFLGAGLGYFGQCSSGTCPLTSTWWRGSIYGAAMGLLFFLTVGNSRSATMDQSSVNVTKIEADKFDKEVMQSPQPVLVDFYAIWCGPCKALAPIVEDLAGQYAGKIKFVKINVDQAQTLSQRFDIQGIPTLLLVKNGKVIDTLVGMTSAGVLKARLQLAVPLESAVTARIPGL